MKTKLILITLGFFTQLVLSQEDIIANQLPPVLTAQISPSDATDDFGNSVSMSADGNVLAIGNRNFVDTIDNVLRGGRVQVFTKENGNWVQKGQDLIGLNDKWNSFGDIVNLSADGNTLTVLDRQVQFILNPGETLADKIGSDTSDYFRYVKVYQFENNIWVQKGPDFLFDGIVNTGDITFSGDGLSIAITEITGVKIFSLIANTWVQVGQQISISDPALVVDIRLSEDGKTIVIGDSYYDNPSSGSSQTFEGKVQVYEYTSGGWTTKGQDLVGTIFQQRLGFKVDITSNGNTIAVGSQGNDEVEIYEYINENWNKKGSSISKESNSGTISIIDFSDNGSILVSGSNSVRLLKYNSDWEQVNLAVNGDGGSGSLRKPMTISNDGSTFVIKAPSNSGTVNIYKQNKNNISRFGDEIYGYGTQDRLGSSVTVSGNGNIIAVGASGTSNNSGTLMYGHVRVFEKTNTGIEQIGADIRNTTDYDSGAFGEEVALSSDGKLLAVSAPSLNSTDGGAVYIYQRNGNNWEPFGNVIYGVAYSNTGQSISFSDDGSILAIGSPGKGASVAVNEHKGYTTIYKYNNANSEWETLGQQIIGEAAWDFSGSSIDLSGDGSILAIGAYGNDGETLSGGHGHVRVFKYNNSSWEQMGQDVDGNPDFNKNFGGIVTLSNDGETLIVSDVSTESNAGSVELYNWDENNSKWQHQTQFKTFNSSGVNNSHRFEFGSDTSISADGKILAIGEYLANGKGKAHIYVKNESGNWVENQLFLEGTNNGSQYFGGNLSLSNNGNTLIVSSSGHNKKGNRAGMAAVYHLNLCSSIDGFEVFDGVETKSIAVSDNLIVNGSAEILPITENGWTSVSGKWEWVVRQVQGVPVKYGHKYFRSTISGAAEIYQDVDVSYYSAAIDAGSQYFYFRTFLQSFQVNGVEDDSQTIVEYRDALGTVLDTYDTGLSQITEDWTLFEKTQLAPVGTKTIRVRLITINNNQYRAPAAFIDNVFLSTTLGPNAVSILDANFEQYLIDVGIDSDGIINKQVLKKDIENVTQLNVNDKNISNLTGIQDFTALVELSATNNQITTIDLSKNLLLEKLFIANNNLSTLNISNNIKLKNLDVGENSLNILDVHQLIDLETLSCYKNKLTTINLISNKKLLSFIANDNQLKFLDIRENTELFWLDLDDNLLEDLMLKNENNTKITNFSVTGNPNLTCIEVDDVSFSASNWKNKDATANYSIDCAPVNDDCSKAIPLTFGQLTPGDVISGTTENTNPSCAVGDVFTDVWYTVVVPSTGEFSVEGSSPIGTVKFAIYQSCTSISAIACGTSISLKNLEVGTPFYLRVWLETDNSKSAEIQSNTGLFSLTVSQSSVLSDTNFTKTKNELMVYPNPTSSIVNIKTVNNDVIEKVELFNVLGRSVLLKINNDTQKVTINTSNLTKGIYFIKTEIKNQLISKRLIVK